MIKRNHRWTAFLASVLVVLAMCCTANSASYATTSTSNTAPVSTSTIKSAATDTTTTDTARKRPKICLVLSGGGARGAAHVGVIKVLEEYRVPIDCIVGTSMGALVGAAYATGMTVPEMENINNSITSELLFKEKPPREQRNMRRKQDDKTILFTPEIGIDDGALRIGKGVVSGIQLETVLRQLTKKKGYYHFDNLPIPYRAVATDLLTGKPVIFSEGELAQVMRASMSVPGAVAPAEFGGMMLVDGMLTSNLPVQTARAMGADVIIAVNVGTPLLKREQIQGILGVSGQMLSILTEQNVQASLATLTPADILISPELDEFTTADFDSLPQITPRGEIAARKVTDRLASLSMAADAYAVLRQKQTTVVAEANPPIAEIRFENLHRVNPETAQSVMETVVGKPIDQPTLDADMRRLYGTGDFEHTNYRLIDEPGNKRVLAVEAIEKSWGPDYLRFGLGLSNDFAGHAYFDLLASYRQTWLNSLGAEWRNDLQIGRTNRFSTEFYQPLNAESHFFIAPYANIERRSADVFQDDNRVASYTIDSRRAGLDVGSQFNRYGELRLGTVVGELEPELDTGSSIYSPGVSKVEEGAYRLRLSLDQLDSTYFPRSGWNANLNIFDSSTDLGADVPYEKWSADSSASFSFGEHTINIAAKGGGKLGGDPLPRYDQFQWGGFLQQGGYATGQLLGEGMEYGRIMYYHRIMRGTLFDGAYGGIAFEASRVDNPVAPGNSEDLLKSGTIFIGSDTALGPAYFGIGHAADGNNAAYLFLGKPY